MDVIAVGAAKKVERKVGKLVNLTTDYKSNTVGAINEVKNEIDYVVNHQLTVPQLREVEFLTQQGEVQEFELTFTNSGYIKGIRCTGDEFTGEFYLKIFTKNPQEGGTYIYYSGKIINVLWDNMNIPFIDESGEQIVYVVLNNVGPITNFKLQIYYTKG